MSIRSLLNEAFGGPLFPWKHSAFTRYARDDEASFLELKSQGRPSMDTITRERELAFQPDLDKIEIALEEQVCDFGDIKGEAFFYPVGFRFQGKDFSWNHWMYDVPCYHSSNPELKNLKEAKQMAALMINDLWDGFSAHEKMQMLQQ